MKKNSLIITIGILLMVLFIALLFAFQVRQTEVAVVTRFGAPVREIPTPGLKFKLPWPVEKVYTFDKRVQNFEGRYEETMTRDNHNLMVMVYTGWKIADPNRFFASFREASVAEAQKSLEGMINSAKNAVVGQHPLTHFLSADTGQLRFGEIEVEIQKAVQEQTMANYGIKIEFLGIKKIGLPESITERVFDRMKSERLTIVAGIRGEGENEAAGIRSGAELVQQKLLAQAQAEATRIRGQGEAEAAEAFAIFEQEPRLAILLLKLNALEHTLKDRTTLILDDRTPPLDMLRGVSEETGKAKK